MTTERKHFAIFYSPGTLFAERSERPIASWDVKEAIILSRTIVERYGAKPWGFRFVTRLVADPVSDGEGGTLKVEPKGVAESPLYILGGEVLSLAALKKRVANGEDKLHILVSNMECNHWPEVVQNDNSWRHVQPFIDGAILLDPKSGKEIARAPGTHQTAEVTPS